MPRWVRFWLVCALVYMTPLVVTIALRPAAFNWWLNWLLVLGPPAVVLLIAFWRARRRQRFHQ